MHLFPVRPLPLEEIKLSSRQHDSHVARFDLLYEDMALIGFRLVARVLRFGDFSEEIRSVGLGVYIYMIRYDGSVQIMPDIDGCSGRNHRARHQVGMDRDAAGVHKIPNHLARIEFRHLADPLLLTVKDDPCLREVDLRNACAVHIDDDRPVVAGPKAVDLQFSAKF